MTLTELKTLHSQGKAISGQSYSAKDKDGKILYFVGTADRRLKEITSSPSKPSVNTTVTNITNNTSSTGVQTVTDDGNGVVVVDNTDPTNPVITYVNPGYLTVETDPIYSAWIAGPPNISEFFNDVGYITSATGTTNLGYTASPTDGTVTSDTGTDATLPLADTTNAGLLSPGDKTKLNNTSGTNTGDNSVNTTSNTYADSKVVNTLINGDTTHAPSSDIVFDALALKITATSSDTLDNKLIDCGTF